MSDDNNNDDIEGKKLNPSFHDLFMNGTTNKLNPLLNEWINQANMADATNPDKKLNPTREKLNPSFQDFGYQSDMAEATNPDEKLNPTLCELINKQDSTSNDSPGYNSVFPNVNKKSEFIPNNSGEGSKSIVPKEIQGWNWGAFTFNWIWGLCNNAWLALIALVPAISLIMSIISGAKGNEWAWQNKKWESIEAFQKTQRKWSAWGLGLFLVWLILVIAPVIVIVWLFTHFL